MLTEVFVHKATSFDAKEYPAASCAVCISELLKKQNFEKACGADISSADCKVLLPYSTKFAKDQLFPNCKQCETVLPMTFKAAQFKSSLLDRAAEFSKVTKLGTKAASNKSDIGSDVSGAVVFIRSFQDRRSLASFL